MNEKYFGEHTGTSDLVDEDDKEEDAPVENSDLSSSSTAKVPELAALVEQTPVGSGIIPDVNSREETMAHEAPVGESETTHYDAQTDKPVAHQAAPAVPEVGSAAVLDPGESEHLRTRWNEIQGAFVDEPHSAVQQADALVSEVIEKITQIFANEHSSLESQWKQGTDVSTEDLRKTLQNYRSFFNRLVV